MQVAIAAYERHEDAQYVAAWNEQEPLLVEAVERVSMPESYRPILCPTELDESLRRCWRTSAPPEEVRPDLLTALAAADLTRFTLECDRSSSGVVIGCGTHAYLAEYDPDSPVERNVGAMISWDVPPLQGSPGSGSIVLVGASLERL
ncbi:hypothetical protein J4G33_12035 [Actinotalea sp. BY-33]|uniref:Uncharacterized protein n=1 Tax=Actinotalea soli TaxID=2819234 RepID=A0A939LPX9_9CELL|nr:hypothetical protein [Actinotalea soli]MBO1752532.1 hypothetical protein [Actinotalea soli]